MKHALTALMLLLPTAAIAQGTVESETIPSPDYSTAKPAGSSEMTIYLTGFGIVNWTAGNAQFAEAACNGFILDRIAFVRANIVNGMEQDGHFISSVEEEPTITVDPAEQQADGSWLAHGEWTCTFTIQYTPSGGFPEF